MSALILALVLVPPERDIDLFTRIRVLLEDVPFVATMNNFVEVLVTAPEAPEVSYRARGSL